MFSSGFTPIPLLALLCCALNAAPQAAWKVIDASLADGSSDHRREALAAIGTIAAPDPEAVRRVEEALGDKDSLVRQTAALVLGELKASSSIPKLRESLEDKGEVAFAAAKALAALDDPDGRDFLIEVLAGERKDTRPGIVASAGRKAKNELRHPRQIIFMGVQDATGAMFGPPALVLPAVRDAADLKGKGSPGRAAAAAYLAKDAEPYAVSLLEWGLGDENQFVRIEAAKGLGQRGNADSIRKLEPLLADEHNYARDMAAAAIIRIEGRGGNAGTPAEGVPQLTPKKQ